MHKRAKSREEGRGESRTEGKSERGNEESRDAFTSSDRNRPLALRDAETSCIQGVEVEAKWFLR